MRICKSASNCPADVLKHITNWAWSQLFCEKVKLSLFTLPCRTWWTQNPLRALLLLSCSWCKIVLLVLIPIFSISYRHLSVGRTEPNCKRARHQSVTVTMTTTASSCRHCHMTRLASSSPQVRPSDAEAAAGKH